MSTYMEKKYGIKNAYAYRVSFYDGGHKDYKRGAAADKFARKCASAGKYNSLLALTNNGWIELAAC